jgi:DNA-binding transcriptional MerR regulator
MQVQPSTPDIYSIGQLSRTFNTSARALRYYEAKGLLAPDRDGPYRIYRRREVQRIRVIVEARRLGLTVEQIRDLLDQYKPADGGCAQLQTAIDYLRRRLSHLNTEAERTAAKLAELEGRLSDRATGRLGRRNVRPHTI